MGVSQVLKIVQKVPNRAKYHYISSFVVAQSLQQKH